MEKSFATGKHIMEDVEYVVGRAWEAMREQYVMEIGKKGFSPVKKSSLQVGRSRLTRMLFKD